MLKIGVIGAGNIARCHAMVLQKFDSARVVAIADVNEAMAKIRAEAFNIEKYYTDYHKILEDPEIEAVTVATPVFTHHRIVLEALAAGKHVMCEKPPCKSVREVEECVKAAEASGKILMWGFLCRFRKDVQFMKEYIDAGHMGKIYQAEACRIDRCSLLGGWFIDKEKAGGGMLLDGVVHELDVALYLMGYPKVKVVTGFSTDVNRELPGKIKGVSASWASMDTNHYERTVESAANGYVLFENGACLYVKSGGVMYAVSDGSYYELVGEKAGARFDKNGLQLVTNVENYLVENKPVLNGDDPLFDKELSCFVERCLNNQVDMETTGQAIELMKIIEGIFKSAETGMPVFYE